jgi:predicted Fe-Mo cluster-binding NifX family protein
MKICITSTGPTLDSKIDPRFGRCQYFIIVDLDTLAFEAAENPNLGAAGGAGIQSAQFISSKGVEVVITGQVGPNAFTTLQAAGIKILTGASGTVEEVVEKYKKGQLSSSPQGPTVQAHFGMGMGGGMGRGMGRGMGMGRGFQPPSPSQPSAAAPQEELKAVKEQSRQLKDQLDSVMQRIEKLEKKK